MLHRVFKDGGPTAAYAFTVVVKTKAGETGEVLGTFTIDKPDAREYPAIEFWKLRKVSVEQSANMSIDSVNIAVHLPKINSGIRKSVYVSVPTAVSCKPVRKGDELVLYVPPMEKTENTTKVLPVACEPKPKKCKT